jgi:perosamine synthetase
MHRQKALVEYGCDVSGSYPIADDLADNGFYLPSASHLDKNTIEFICDKIKEVSKSHS